MAEPERARSRLRFGVFELDLRAGELLKHGRRLRLQEQPFRVLATLLEHPGEVVTREELQKELWPSDTFVNFDHGLNKAINKLRDALGDSADSPRFIETVARRGYRFLASVEVGVATAAASEGSAGGSSAGPSATSLRQPVGSVDSPAAQAENSVSRHHRLPPLAWKAALVAALMVVAALVVWNLQRRTHASPVIRSLAVLPLESLSNDASQDYFADGMTDELISELGHIGALRVISRTSVMAYKHARKTIPQIAGELNVDAIVEGTVLRSGNRVRITAQLIDASADQHLWSRSYEGELRDTLALQSEVARAIADQIQIKLNPSEHAALKRPRVVNPDAYVSYLKGRYFWNRRSADGLKAALAYFNQAIEEDPTYAPAYSGLADTYALLGDWQYAVMTATEALPKAKAAAARALELDGSLGEAHNSLAFCLDGFDWAFDAAGKEFQRAIELNPGYASGHHWYAWHLALLHRYDEALGEMRRAASLDPLSLVISADLAELLGMAGLYDESIRQSRKAIEMDPAFGLAHNHLGQAYLQKHMYNEAIVELREAVRLSHGAPTCIANLARACAASGRRGEAERLLRELKERSSPGHSAGSEIAMIYASLGQADQAFTWLEKGYEERFNPGVLLRPGFDPLRSEARFRDLVRRVGLPQ